MFFSKIPRAKIYLGFKKLLAVFFLILFQRIKLGEKTKQWENALSRYFGTKEAIALPRARIALFYLLKNLGLPKGGEVILTPLTIADIVNAVHWAGLRPVFCDLGKNTYNIDCQKLEASITPKTKAVLVTHLTGLSSDMDEIEKITKKHNLILLEDISQSFGANFKGRPLGTFGLAGIASTSFLKTCCTLYGGVMILNNPELAEKIRNDIKTLPLPSKKFLLKETIRNIVLYLTTQRIIFSLFTYNLLKIFNKLNSNVLEEFIKSNPKPILLDRPPAGLFHSFTDLQAKMGLKILKNLEASDNQRITKVKYFIENLSPRAKSYLPIIPSNARNVFWRLPFSVENPEEFKKYLFKNYIDSTRTNLILCSQEPAFKKFAARPTPEAQKAHSPVFIPIHSSFSKKDMAYMARVINKYFEI